MVHGFLLFTFCTDSWICSSLDPANSPSKHLVRTKVVFGIISSHIGIVCVRAQITSSCSAARPVGVAWIWSEPIVSLCLIRTGTRPMTTKQWHVCGETARRNSATSTDSLRSLSISLISVLLSLIIHYVFWTTPCSINCDAFALRSFNESYTIKSLYVEHSYIKPHLYWTHSPSFW